MTTGKHPNDDTNTQWMKAISESSLPIVEMPIKTHLYRAQDTHYDSPLYYNPDSDTRYGDRQKQIGVCYLGGSPETAIAETLQYGKSGPGSPTLFTDIEEKSLHEVVTLTPLRLVDVVALAKRCNVPLSEMVASNEGQERYSLTQAFADAIMRHKDQVDGIIYPSQANPSTGTMGGINVVLFAGRGHQLQPVSKQALMDIELESGETVVELLVGLGYSIE